MLHNCIFMANKTTVLALAWHQPMIEPNSDYRSVFFSPLLCSKLTFLRLGSGIRRNAQECDLEHYNNPNRVFIAHIVYSKKGGGQATLFLLACEKIISRLWKELSPATLRVRDRHTFYPIVL